MGSRAEEDFRARVSGGVVPLVVCFVLAEAREERLRLHRQAVRRSGLFAIAIIVREEELVLLSGLILRVGFLEDSVRRAFAGDRTGCVRHVCAAALQTALDSSPRWRGSWRVCCASRRASGEQQLSSAFERPRSSTPEHHPRLFARLAQDTSFGSAQTNQMSLRRPPQKVVASCGLAAMPETRRSNSRTCPMLQVRQSLRRQNTSILQSLHSVRQGPFAI